MHTTDEFARKFARQHAVLNVMTKRAGLGDVHIKLAYTSWLTSLSPALMAVAAGEYATAYAEASEAPPTRAVSAGLSGQVDQAAKLLDQHYPGWADKIDLRTFDIQSIRSCVLAQVAGEGSYGQGVDDLTSKIGEIAWVAGKYREVFAPIWELGNEVGRLWVTEIRSRRTA